MPKPLLFVLPALLLSAPVMAEQQTPSPALQAGLSASPDVRTDWMREAVGDILEGRVADQPPQSSSAETR